MTISEAVPTEWRTHSSEPVSKGTVNHHRRDNVVSEYDGGLTGAHDFDLTFTADQMPQGRGDPPPGAPPPPAIDPNGPSLFTALQEQLGLKRNRRA